MNRIVVITGGAGALGSTLAKSLAALGYKTALLDTERARGRLDELVKEIGAGSACGVTGDFSTSGAWTDALAKTKSALGGAPTHAALIAGGWEGGAPLHEIREEAHAKVMSSNVDTVYRALRAVLPAMIEAKSGSIVAVGSRAAVQPWTSANAASYAAAKAAVVALVEATAQEVLAHGVRINAIMPSTMDTPANRAAMPDADPRKWVSLASAASVIAFLLSEDARDVSGAAIPIYGRS